MSASRNEFYAVAAERLAAYAASARPAAVTAVADEILAFSGVMLRHPRLRRALAAQTRSATDRIDLLGSLLRDRVDDRTIELVGALIPGRWARPGELLDAVERLGVDALLTSGELAGELATVEDELFRFSRIVAGDPRLGATLNDVTVDTARRSTLVRDLLTGRALPLTIRLVEIALVGYGGRGFVGSMTRLVELVAERRERTIAYVTTAIPLTADQEVRLTVALTARYRRRISLKTDIDPAVMGGAMVRVGADLYDGTVRRRIAAARDSLTR